MQAIQVAAATYYFDFPSIIGLYLLDDHNCCLIDSGEKIEHVQHVYACLHEQGYQVKAILSTHFHPDHCSGHGWLQNRQPECAIYATSFEAAILENPELSPFTLYTAAPPKVLQNRYLLAPPCRVTHRIKPGITRINNQEFKTVDLAGHTLGHLGWVTPDGVLFAGDSLIAPAVLASTKMNYTADVGTHINTLNSLQTEPFAKVVSAHGGLLSDVPAAVIENQAAVKTLLLTIQELISVGSVSLEDIMAGLFEHLDLPFNHSQYYLIRATTSACLTYLYQQRLVATQLKSGRLLYFCQ